MSVEVANMYGGSGATSGARFDCSQITAKALFQFSVATTLDLSGLDTSNMTDMSKMFTDCAYLESLDLSGFDTSNVTDMSEMFYNCLSLTVLDLSSFGDTSDVTDMGMMFAECVSLKKLIFPGFDMAQIDGMIPLFDDCENLRTLVIGRNTDTRVRSISGTLLDDLHPDFKIYVPDHLVEAYKRAEYWSEYADKILPQSELPEE